jgi:serine/threonine protein kinase
MSSEAERLAESLSGRYAIERELARGGMATVCVARDLRHDRRVALKVVKPDLAHAPGRDRFLRENRDGRTADSPSHRPALRLPGRLLLCSIYPGHVVGIWKLPNGLSEVRVYALDRRGSEWSG